jgi:hypothetical protein
LTQNFAPVDTLEALIDAGRSSIERFECLAKEAAFVGITFSGNETRNDEEHPYEEATCGAGGTCYGERTDPGR